MSEAEPKFRWLKVRDLHEPRATPKCTLLADGRVRVEGGQYFDLTTHRVRRASTEVYSPDEDTWTQGDVAGPAAAKSVAATKLRSEKRLARDQPTVTRLTAGTLVSGGSHTSGSMDGEERTHSFNEVEWVDPATGKVHDAGKLPTATHRHGVVELACGAVLVIGGDEGDDSGSRAVQLGVPHGLDLTKLGPALAKLAAKALGGQRLAALLDEVRALIEADKLDEALALALEATRSSPQSADAWRAVGLSHGAAKRFDEAVEPLRHATKLDPEDPFACSELADALFFSGEQGAAKKGYARVLELCGDDPTWTWKLVQRAREQLQFMALEAGDLAGVAKGPGDDATSLEWNNTGVALNREGKNAEAARAFDRATKLDPTNDFAWGNLASVLTQLGRPKDVLAAAEQTLAHCREPNRKAQAHVSRGIALYDLGEYGESVKAYDASLKLHALPYAWNNRANSLRKLGRDDEAFESFERACALGHHAAHWGLACIWVLRGDLHKAQAEVDLAAKADPSTVRQMRADEELAPLWKRSPRKRKRP
jgi:tetratricopeptide (TPR) repeat protein